MAELRELVHVLRSKNAGPFQITFDLIFKDQQTFERAEASGVFAPGALAKVLNYRGQDVRVVYFPPARAIKITVPRTHSSGSFGDTDVYGCQQHVPRLELDIS